MNKLLLTVCCMIMMFLASCERGEHFIKDKSYREKVEIQFEKQKQLGKSRWEQVFKLADQKMPIRETEALKFLLAYSSLSDIADYDGGFFLANIRSSFAARDSFSWGKTLPDELFRHFVLPVRVNNENLDSSRMVFFAELKDRVKKLSMKDAVLDVNHWCHEKVTYRGTDGRTSSPLSTVKTAYGRCGEESTFTVAALRSVCIPARQCYTPRWAHSDDNHAWVEVWVDGKWHYIGACEPEAVLDAAWFTAPAKRAMLVNTNVFGDYEGPEDVLLKDERYTKINILPNYAETKRIFVQVRDSSGKPADSASVEFQLYNYAEFYTLLSTTTDSKGICSFLTGYGDLLIWAARNGRFAYRKISVSSSDTIVMDLLMKPGKEFSVQEDFIPPPEKPAGTLIPDSVKESNSRLLMLEDKIRGAYEKTFIDSAKTYRLAATLKLNPDTLWLFMRESRGNYRVIIDFAGSVKANKKAWMFPLLWSVSTKDLRDITFEVLMDNIENTVYPGTSGKDFELFAKYILNPRVDNELLKPYKAFLQAKFDTKFKADANTKPGMIIEWVKANVLIDTKANYGRAPLSPVGVYELKVADPHSRDIFFVALCRSLGIASRLEPGTRLPQFYHNSQWQDVLFDPKKPDSPERVKLTLFSDPLNVRKPEYYIHFTIEKYEDGFYRSLDYEADPQVGSFPCSLELAEGNYLMVIGNRIKDGTVLASLSFFNLEKGKDSRQMISFRKEPATTILGTVDPGKLNTALSSTRLPGKANLILAWIEPDKEPTKHFLADLRDKKKDFEKSKCNIFLIFRNEKEKQDFIAGTLRELPSGIRCVVPGTELIKMFSSATSQSLGSSLPAVTLVNTKGEILYLSQGYRIGLGDDLIKLLR